MRHWITSFPLLKPSPEIGRFGRLSKRRDEAYVPAMGFSFESMAEELGARRRRLRRALQPWRASLAEFVLLGGLSLGLLGPLLVAPGGLDWRWGLLPPVLFVAGYIGLDAWRQRGEAASSRGQDWAALGLAAACAALGFFLYASAVTRPAAPPPAPAEESFVPSEAPRALETDIVN